MAWTTPRTWVTGETETATIFNTHVRDNLNAITGATASYGTAATVWGSTGTTPSIGNGTFVSTFRQDNKWVDLFVQITFGSTTTAGTGIWTIALPATARYVRWIRYAAAFDNSATATFAVSADAASTSSLNIRGLLTAPPTGQGNVPGSSSASPFTWAVNDIFTLDIRYEAA